MDGIQFSFAAVNCAQKRPRNSSTSLSAVPGAICGLCDCLSTRKSAYHQKENAPLNGAFAKTEYEPGLSLILQNRGSLLYPDVIHAEWGCNRYAGRGSSLNHGAWVLPLLNFGVTVSEGKTICSIMIGARPVDPFGSDHPNGKTAVIVITRYF